MYSFEDSTLVQSITANIFGPTKFACQAEKQDTESDDQVYYYTTGDDDVQ